MISRTEIVSCTSPTASISACVPSFHENSPVWRAAGRPACETDPAWPRRAARARRIGLVAGGTDATDRGVYVYLATTVRRGDTYVHTAWHGQAAAGRAAADDAGARHARSPLCQRRQQQRTPVTGRPRQPGDNPATKPRI